LAIWIAKVPTPPAARDEYALAGAQVQLVAQRLQRGERGERHGRRR